MKLHKTQKVLFIGHGCHRTGAPLLLREFLRFLTTDTNLTPHLLLLSDGPLAADYRALCKTDLIRARVSKNFAFASGIRSISNCIISSLIGIRSKTQNDLYPLNEYPVVYSNTIASTRAVMDLYVPGRIIIQHVHELSYASEVLQVREILRESVSKTYRFIAASAAVAKYLSDEIYVPEDKIIVIHEFPVSTCRNTSLSASHEIREKCGISVGDSLIGMCGTPEWRKGVDLFIQLSRTLKEKQGGGKYHFIWVGGNKDQLLESLHDIRLTGNESCIHFIGDVEFPIEYYRAMDLFALTSREDPFPVAMLEAASCGLPIVCFEHAGGAPEFVAQDSGRIVPYLDIQGMADACEKLCSNNDLRKKIGLAGRRKVEVLYSPERQMAKQLEVIQEALNNI